MSLDFAWSELELKVYRGREITIIEELKARLISAAKGTSYYTDSLPEQ